MTKKTSSVAVEDTVFQVVVQRLAREGFLIVCSLGGLFLVLALLTQSNSDPGFNTTGTADVMENAMGASGAWLASLLLYLLGYLAYMIPGFLFFQVGSSLRDGKDTSPISWQLFVIKLFGFFLLILASTGLAALHFGVEPQLPSAGGIIGALIADLLVPALALLGTTLVLFGFFLLGLTITVNISWLAFIDRVGLLSIELSSQSVALVKRAWSNRSNKHDAKLLTETRKKKFNVQIEKQKKRIPPTIEIPDLKVSPRSVRVEKERQGSLFTSSSSDTLPEIGLLDAWQETNDSGFSKESLEAMSRLLELKLKDFGIEIEVTAVNPGPVITRFEVQPAPGIKVSRISALAKDLARSLALVSVRVVEVIPGKTVIGIEIPNETREVIQLSQVLSSPEFDKASSPVSVALGHDIVGKPEVVDLAKMPHLLVAGTTGSGKSVGINAMILSILFKSTPDQVRIIMIDPKMLELSVYDGIPHLLTPVITDMKDAANGLRWCVGEMERRYKLMSLLGVRNLAGYNKKVNDAKVAGKPICDPTWIPDPMLLSEEQVAPELEVLPTIIVIVDELADMMMVVGKKVEELIARIAQKARAAGIHLILATQRPSVDVLTGLIKANVPTRLSFMVQSKVDSRTILGEGGAEQLLGNGDMLFLPPGGGVPTRVHGAFVSDEEVHRVVADWKSRGSPVYIDSITQGAEDGEMGNFVSSESDSSEGDALYDEAVAFVLETRKASISSVQRKLRIGYNRAARMIESMEAAGVISPMGSNGGREVIAPSHMGD